jgi:hypothetical protein
LSRKIDYYSTSSFGKKEVYHQEDDHHLSRKNNVPSDVRERGEQVNFERLDKSKDESSNVFSSHEKRTYATVASTI